MENNIKKNYLNVFIKTYGCQMNVYDSQNINDSLEFSGKYKIISSLEEADLIFFNTCHIREKSVEKLYSDLGRLRLKLKKNNKNKIIVGIIGCIAQAEGEEILKREPIVDLVIGPQNYHRLEKILQMVKKGKKIVEIDYRIKDKFQHLHLQKKDQITRRGVNAFLTIQEGCDKFCTFCVVPYTRGSEYSRSIDHILQEAEKLVQSGVSEITLLGQNVNNWRYIDHDNTKWGLGKLLFRLSKIQGIQRLRYTTNHPLDVDDSLIQAHSCLPILMPYLHLPVQSGSDKILKSMNRRHNVSYYLDLIKKIRISCPEIAISSDFIVGFPGETESDFEETIQLINNVCYASSYSFKYSPRPGTPSSKFKNQIDETTKARRLKILQDLLKKQKNIFFQEKLGTTTQVLIEKPSCYEKHMIGRSPWLIPVSVKTNAKVGTIIDVILQKAENNSFIGLSKE